MREFMRIKREQLRLEEQMKRALQLMLFEIREIKSLIELTVSKR